MDSKLKLNFQPPNILKDVQDFFFVAQPEMIVKPNEVPNKRTLQLAYNLINEEVNKELLPMLQKLIDGAYSQELMVEVLDGYIDTIYVAIWGCIAFNLPFNPAWHVVQENNISKFPIHVACEGKGCDYEVNATNIDYEEQQIMIDQSCVRGRLLTTNCATGKVVKPQGFKKVPLWEVVHQVWQAYAIANPPKPMSPPDINGSLEQEFPEL